MSISKNRDFLLYLPNKQHIAKFVNKCNVYIGKLPNNLT